MGMLAGGFFSQGGTSEPTINTAGDLDITNTVSGGPTYAGIEINGNGSTNGSDSDGSNSWAPATPLDDWLLSGSSSGLYVERAIVSGSADWIDEIGTSRVAVSGSPRIGCTRAAGIGADTLVVTLDFYDVSSGGTSIGTISNIQIQAVISA